MIFFLIHFLDKKIFFLAETFFRKLNFDYKIILTNKWAEKSTRYLKAETKKKKNMQIK